MLERRLGDWRAERTYWVTPRQTESNSSRWERMRRMISVGMAERVAGGFDL
jgi:hypothetical protein